MSERTIAALLSVTSQRAPQIENLAREKELADLIHKKLGYSYQKRYITYNGKSSITIFMVHGPKNAAQGSKSNFRKIISQIAESLGQRFVAFIEYGKGAEVVTSDLGSVIEHLDEQDSNWIVCRYSAWMLGEPFSKMNESSVRFVSTQDARSGLFGKISSMLSRREYVKRGRK